MIPPRVKALFKEAEQIKALSELCNFAEDQDSPGMIDLIERLVKALKYSYRKRSTR